MLLIDFETQLTAFLHPGSLVSCHNFLILILYFNSRFRPGRLLFNSDKVILLVDSLYAEATEAVKARAALSASAPELISMIDQTVFTWAITTCSEDVGSIFLRNVGIGLYDYYVDPGGLDEGLLRESL
jgi:hypothetical protein